MYCFRNITLSLSLSTQVELTENDKVGDQGCQDRGEGCLVHSEEAEGSEASFPSYGLHQSKRLSSPAANVALILVFQGESIK